MSTGISLPLKSNQCSLSLDKLYNFVSPCFIGLKWRKFNIELQSQV